MEYILIPAVAIAASALTFFSGFGLGTILLPAFALFFPVHLAVAMTAVVHFLNNVFKFLLVSRQAHRGTVLSFGIPAVLFSFLGAWLLVTVSETGPLATYSMASRSFAVMPVKLIIGALMIGFAFLELFPLEKKLRFKKAHQPLGGMLSGFFGGLSGHQGAFRSVFLLRAGLTKEQFVATGVVIACLVDAVRMTVYGARIDWQQFSGTYALVILATGSAFAGAYLGKRLLAKVTLQAVQWTVAILLMVLGLLIAAGII